MPSECESIENPTSAEVLSNWADANTDKAGQAYGTRLEDANGNQVVEPQEGEDYSDYQSTGVMYVKGEVDSVREAIEAEDGTEPCLISDDYSKDDLDAVRELATNEIFDNTGAESLNVGSSTNRLEISVLTADKRTVRKLIEAVGDPKILRIEGIAVVLA